MNFLQAVHISFADGDWLRVCLVSTVGNWVGAHVALTPVVAGRLALWAIGQPAQAVGSTLTDRELTVNTKMERVSCIGMQNSLRFSGKFCKLHSDRSRTIAVLSLIMLAASLRNSDFSFECEVSSWVRRAKSYALVIAGDRALQLLCCSLLTSV